MIMRTLYFAICALLLVHASGQSDSTPRVKAFTPYKTVDAAATSSANARVQRAVGNVVYHQDDRIAQLMDELSRAKQVIRGYRVQIFLGDRTQAEELRRHFLLKHPTVPAYMPYQAPNFKVRVGDCRTRLEAEKLRRSIKDEFPGAYLVPDEIEMPRLPEPAQ